MFWKEDWPVIGVDIDRNGIGEPVYVWRKPNVGKDYPVTAPQSSDEFNTSQLGFQWAWNHNPVNEAWSLSAKQGFLSITALEASSFLKAKNTLTQKVMGPTGEATTLMLTSKMNDGQKAGLCLIGKQYNLLGIIKKNGSLYLFTDINGKTTEQPLNTTKIYLKVEASAKEGNNRFYYSLDNQKFIPASETFVANFGYWKGPKLGLFSYNENQQRGIALFDWFRYKYDGPQNIEAY
jgi:beta-xylosidase